MKVSDNEVKERIMQLAVAAAVHNIKQNQAVRKKLCELILKHNQKKKDLPNQDY